MEIFMLKQQFTKSLGFVFIMLSLTLVFFTSLGCSGISKKSCSDTDWKQQGITDGNNGKAATDILNTEKSCKEKNADFPILTYKQGWVEGIQVYCSPENGFKLASQGQKLKVENCPIEFQPKLVDSIKKGEEFLKAEKSIARLEKAEEKMKDKRASVKEDISETKKEIEKLKENKEKILSSPEVN